MKRTLYSFVILITTLFCSCNNQTNENNNKVSDSTVVEINDSAVAKDTSQNVKQENILTSASNEKSISTLQTAKKISLSEVYKHFEKLPQTFIIQPNKDTTIICKEGTSIKIPANSFVNAKTGNATTNKIKICIKEYYKLSDIILANLSTTSGKDILETGGMIKITAESNNEECIVKKGKEIEVGFPYSTKKKDMQLFSGHWDNNICDWKSIKSELVQTHGNGNAVPKYGKSIMIRPHLKGRDTVYSPESIVTTVEEMPTYPGGEEELMKYISQKIKYPFSALEKNIEGTVYVEFVIDEIGRAISVSVKRGINAELDKVAYDLIRKMPKWKPGKQNNQPVAVCFILPVKFAIKNKLSAMSDKEIREAKLIEMNLKNINVIYGNTETNTDDKDYKEEFEKNTNETNIQTADMFDVNRYLFSTSNLGWINCDRFRNENIEKTNYIVQSNSDEQYDVKLIFRRVKSIMAGNRTNDGLYTFSNVPLGEMITIVALKTENGKVLLAVKETSVKRIAESELNFEAVSMAKLQSEMKKLNSIN